jgi:8-oxo-dGTP pyrophosphatase MutT (NUDIX family)
VSSAIGSPGGPLWDPDAVPAATVVVVRDRDGAVEVLMLKRDAGLSFAGGMWVFPGGRIDPGDHPADGDDPVESIEEAARAAAVREAAEEAGIEIDPEALRRWSHWTPPPRQDKRFTTAFFVAPAVDDTADVVIDDGEIRDHRWTTPAEALALRDAGEITLAPPTFITLTQLLPHDSVAGVLAAAPGAPDAVEHFATRIVVIDDEWIALYHGDAAYELHADGGLTVAPGDTADDRPAAADAAGPRHRLVMGPTWTYVRETT